MILSPTPENLQRAADALKRGDLIVMPTETVYGLACDALNAEAADKLYEVKGRPKENPIIVHVYGHAMLDRVATKIDEDTLGLVERFWPGPLTLVLKKRPEVPAEITSGLDTVAVRCPSHPVAQELLQVFGGPIGAPSANRFMALSATAAEDVDPLIASRAEMVLQGGPCSFGLESTVLDMSQSPPRLLRPGSITRSDIQATLGMPLGTMPPLGQRRSPGMYARHYAPNTRLLLIPELHSDQPGLTFGEPKNAHQLQMPDSPTAYAMKLYAALHQLDTLGLDTIYVATPPETPEWEAVQDRLSRASAS